MNFFELRKGVPDLKLGEEILYKERDFFTTVGSIIFVEN